MQTTYRIERERQYWDAHSAGDAYAGWEEATYNAWRRWPLRRCATDFLEPLAGQRLLLCSEGEEAIYFAREGAEIWCFDVSAVRVEALRDLAIRCGVAERIHLGVMPFEQLSYEDDFFDLAFGQAIIHHVDLEQAGEELSRVLRPGGRASFIEPLGTNPLLRFARRSLPYRGKDGRTEDEEPLTFDDIARFGAAFAAVHSREFRLLGMLRRRIIQNDAVCDALDRIDGVLTAAVPPLRRFCQQVWVGVEAAPSADQTGK